MSKEEINWEEAEKWLATEVIGQARRSAARWFVAWLATMAALVGTNVAWVLAAWSK